MYIKDLPIGATVKDLSTKYNNKPIIWRIVSSNHTGYPANSTTLMSDKILSIKYFDSPETANSDTNRKTYGNNRWSNSNIQQWLNSNKNSPWFTALHSYDKEPNVGANPYSTEHGFLTNFSEGFKTAIQDTTLKNLLANVDGSGQVESTVSKVFLFSMTELGLAGSTGKEGNTITYLSDANNRKAKPTAEAVSTSLFKETLLSPDLEYFYWLRSALTTFSHINYRITGSGSFANSPSNNDAVGILPALNITNTSQISYQDTDGAYVLAFSGVQEEDLSLVKFELKETVSNTVIPTGKSFSNSIKLDWNSSDGNVNFTLQLKKDNVTVPYTTRNTALSALGKYSAVIVATDKNFPTNTRSSEPILFSIVPAPKNLSTLGFKITNALDITEIKNNDVYLTNVQPTWANFADVTTIVTLSKNGTNDSTFAKNKLLADVGSYVLSYLLTDDFNPTNQLSGILNFQIKSAPFDWTTLKHIVTDDITKRTISVNSIFETKVKPTWTELATVTYSYTLMYENTLIAYAKGATLSNLGKYILKFKMTDKSYTSNTFTIDIPFEVILAVTDLSTFEPDFIDLNLPTKENTIIAEGQIFKGEVVKPSWNTLPSDVTVTSYKLSRDLLTVPFTRGTDEYTAFGEYVITLNVRNGSGATATYLRSFEIKDVALELEDILKVVTDFDESEIYEGRKFEEELVLPNWDESVDISVFYSLTLDGEEVEFIKGITVLAEHGKYSLELIVEETDNPSNTKTMIRNFEIVNSAVNMGDITMIITNLVTGLVINNNDVYKGIEVKPYWYSSDYEESLMFESWITYNGVRRVYDKTDEEDILVENGSYVLEVRATDVNFPTNFKVTTRVFDIIADSVELNDKEIVIKHKPTGDIITEGQIFRGVYASVQPTWSEFPELIYTFTLYYNNIVKTNYVKDSILRDKGQYRLIITAVDPNYPENKLETNRTFSVLDEINPDDSDNTNEEAYLNGLPYLLGTPIVESGDYNLLVMRKKTSNFQITMSEVNFKVVDLGEEQKPLIMIDPEVVPAIMDVITIRFPEYAMEQEYRINNGEWKFYEHAFEVTDNCTIYARYRDPIGHFVTSNKDVTNIDKLPPAPPVLLGFKENVNIYYSVSPMVEYVHGVDFTATLDGKPYELGTPIYNEIAEVRDYTLVVTAKKRLNGLSATTVRKFTLDSVPPVPPVIIGFNHNEIQQSARPEVANKLSTNDYEAYLNGRMFNLGTLVDDPNSYVFSVTAIKKVNGLRATSVASFTILWTMPEPIGPLRISLEPLVEANKAIAIDGEMIVDRPSAHISIYDDGFLISKTKELEEMLDILDKRIISIETTLDTNETRIDSLTIMRNTLRINISQMQAKNNDVQIDVNRMKTIIDYLDFVDLSMLKDFEKELTELDIITQNIRARIDALRSKLNGKINIALQIMGGLQTNSSFIGEVTWKKNNPKP